MIHQIRLDCLNLKANQVMKQGISSAQKNEFVTGMLEGYIEEW